MHVLLHYLSQLVVKMFPKSPAHDWWSFGLLAPSSQQTPVKCIFGRVPAQLPFPCREQVTTKAEAGYNLGYHLVQKEDKSKISSSSWISKKFFPWRCLRARDFEEGTYLKQREEFLGEEWYKSMMWELPLPCWLPSHGASRSCWQEGKHWCGSDSF